MDGCAIIIRMDCTIYHIFTLCCRYWGTKEVVCGMATGTGLVGGEAAEDIKLLVAVTGAHFPFN